MFRFQALTLFLCIILSSKIQGFQLKRPLSSKIAVSSVASTDVFHRSCSCSYGARSAKPCEMTMSATTTTTTTNKACAQSRFCCSLGSLTCMTLINHPATWIVATILGGNIGTPFVAQAKKAWYDRIPLPDWTPPNFVFAPVWITLYSSMGYAAFRVYQLKGLSSLPMKLALIHYLLNTSWAPIFFGMKRLRLGHVLNILLIATLLPIIPLFYQVDPLSGILLLPYMTWLFVATALSSAICALNPTVQGYNNAMLEADIYKLQKEAAKYAGL